MKCRLAIILALLVMVSCATRQVMDNYSGATEQRLVAHSVNKIMEQLPEEDFNVLSEESVFVTCLFLNESETLAYARNRMKMALVEKYGCRLVDDPEQAKFRLTVFFTALGTDFDKLGITTPEMVLPVMGGAFSIDVIALEMYHGVSELYYYIQDPAGTVIAKGDMLKQVVRNDTLVLPILTIPVSRLD